MTHPTPTHPTPTRPGLASPGFQPPWGKPKPKPSGPPAPKGIEQRCTNPLPHGPHPVRPRRLTWTSFQCAGRPSVAEQDRELDAALGSLTS